MTPAGQPRHLGPISPHQGFLLPPTPAFDLPLTGRSFLPSGEFLRKQQYYRKSSRGIAVNLASLIFGYALLMPGVAGVIGTAQNVNLKTHVSPVCCLLP